MPDHLPGKRSGIPGHQQYLFDTVHTFGADRRGDHRNSIVQGLDDLPLDSGTVTQRGHHQPATSVKPRQFGIIDKAGYQRMPVGPGQDRLRRMGSDNMEFQIGNGLADLGINFV